MQDSCAKSNPSDHFPGEKTGLQTGYCHDIHRSGTVSLIAMIGNNRAPKNRR
jgi:hypothetical protein